MAFNKTSLTAVKFEVTEGWSVYGTDGKLKGTIDSTTFSDETTAANVLKNSYVVDGQTYNIGSNRLIHE